MQSDLTNILKTPPSEFPNLLNIWEASVRATHDFLNEQQVAQIKALIIQHNYFDHVQLFHVEREGKIAGFLGLAYKKIEMLFVHPDFFNLGIGSMLIQKAFELKANEVDVNEQNPKALAFYKKHYFQQVARSELDAEGNPFPILHLKLKSEEVTPLKYVE